MCSRMLITPSMRLHLVAEPHMLTRVSVLPQAQQPNTSIFSNGEGERKEPSYQRPRVRA